MDQILETLKVAVNGLIHLFSAGRVSHDEAIGIVQIGVVLALVLGLVAVFVGKTFGRALGFALGALAILALIASLVLVFTSNILP